MSTVVASSLPTWALWLTPWRATLPDSHALDRVLAKYGLEPLPGGHRGLEFIAGQGLTPDEAASLAEDLRNLGLHARVSQKDVLTSSSRIANAFVAQFFGFIATVPLALTLLPAVGVAAPVAGVTIALSGGNRLELAAEPPSDDQGMGATVAAVRRIAALLPEHVGAPMLERTRRLAARANAQPDGEAAAELRAMAEDLTAEQDHRDAEEARALKRELAEARRAMRELQR